MAEQQRQSELQMPLIEMGRRKERWQIRARGSTRAAVLGAVVAACSADACSGTPSWTRPQERQEDFQRTCKRLARNFSWQD